MRTWDRLSATFVRGLSEPGKFYDGGGLMLTAAPTAKGVVNKAWLFRFQIDKRERVMGLGCARVVAWPRPAPRRTKPQAARGGIDPLTQRNADRVAARAAELHTATFKQCLDQFLTATATAGAPKHSRQWRNSMATYCKPLMEVRSATSTPAWCSR